MTVILMRNTPAGRRAYAIKAEEAAAMVAAGEAVQDKTHTGIFEEVTEAERDQGYMTRNMQALPVTAKRRGRPPKVRTEEDSGK